MANIDNYKNFPAYLIIGQNNQVVVNQLIGQFFGKTIDLKKAHPDIFIVRSETSIGIDNVRQIQNFLMLKPYQNDFKIALIEEADRMTEEAQNAFLKNLEEASHSSVILLTTGNQENIIPTIVSRCLKIFTGYQHDVSIHQDAIQEKDLWSNEPISRLINSQKIITEKGDWIDRQIVFWRLILLAKIVDHQLIKKNRNDFIKLASNINIDQIQICLNELLKTKEALNANANPLLAIDNLLLTIPKLSA